MVEIPGSRSLWKEDLGAETSVRDSSGLLVFYSTKYSFHFHSGESSWIAFSRGLLALLVITSLAVFALLEIVALPVSEMGLTPNRVFRTQYLPLTFNSTTPIVWNLIVVRTRAGQYLGFSRTVH